MIKNAKKKFLHDIEKKIIVSNHRRSEFLKILKHNLENYVVEYPDATYSDLENTFGTAGEIAKAYYDSIDDQEIIQKLKVKRKIFIIIIIFITALALVYCYYYYRLIQDIPTYAVEEIIELN